MSTEASATGGGDVLEIGNPAPYGSLSGQTLNEPVVGMARTHDGGGYWLVAADGGVFAFGDAGFYGSTGAPTSTSPSWAWPPPPTGTATGWWPPTAACSPSATPGSTARRAPSTSTSPSWAWPPPPTARLLVGRRRRRHVRLRRRRVLRLEAATHAQPAHRGHGRHPRRHGYWLVAADGGVFAFGDAGFYGSTGDVPQPAHRRHGRHPDRTRLLVVAADGGMFAFGDAGFFGSASPGRSSNRWSGLRRHRGEVGTGWWRGTGCPGQTPADRFCPRWSKPSIKRDGIVSAEVLDLDDRIRLQLPARSAGVTASIVKVEILGTLLAEAQAEGRGLTPTEQSTAAAMIEISDNDSATALWNEVGGAPAVAAFDRSVGMTSTTPGFAWGLTVTTAADQVTLLQHLVEPNPASPTAPAPTSWV